ncbi:MAG: permease [Gemmatimonadales bacterium]|nr:permease [Gemmatimonadales bacterium]
MSFKNEWKPFFWLTAGFLAIYHLPVGQGRFDNAIVQALELVKWYAREHVLLCLVPAFFIAGAISVFVSQGSVMRYLGPGAKKLLAYGVASVSGSILAVCSCTVLPLFAGIYRMGAGLGPATAFLYSGPAINVLAIILTARILGLQLGIGRAVGAVLFSIVIGLLMHFFFRKEEQEKQVSMAALPEPEAGRPLWRTALQFTSLVGLLIFANWGAPDQASGFWIVVHDIKWFLAGGFLLLTVGLATGLTREENSEWVAASWGFAKQIMPLLLIGVLVSGMLLGRPGHEGLIPSAWIAGTVGGNSLLSNVIASASGAFMYFATMTEVPILQGLLGAGMGQGPALALMLAGPAVSLPSILVMRSIMGDRKTAVFILLVIVMSSFTGWIFGSIVAA